MTKKLAKQTNTPTEDHIAKRLEHMDQCREHKAGVECVWKTWQELLESIQKEYQERVERIQKECQERMEHIREQYQRYIDRVSNLAETHNNAKPGKMPEKLHE